LDNRTGKQVLIKQISKKLINSDSANKDILQKEFNLLKRLKHEIFVKTLENLEDDSFYYLIQEYLEGGTLENYIQANINSNKPISEKFIQSLLKQLIPAFRFFNENNIILDIITPKSFYFKFYENDENFQIKFFDFGISTIYMDIHTQRNYQLIESKKGKVISQKTNILSLGMTVFKLLFGDTIYKFNSQEDPTVTLSSSKIIYLLNIF
jgi:calcium-dependent protein kinase